MAGSASTYGPAFTGGVRSPAPCSGRVPSAQERAVPEQTPQSMLARVSRGTVGSFGGAIPSAGCLAGAGGLEAWVWGSLSFLLLVGEGWTRRCSGLGSSVVERGQVLVSLKLSGMLPGLPEFPVTDSMPVISLTSQRAPPRGPQGGHTLAGAPGEGRDLLGARGGWHSCSSTLLSGGSRQSPQDVRLLMSLGTSCTPSGDLGASHAFAKFPPTHTHTKYL